MNYSNGPIGLFDSGVGGLTVARAIARKLPKESIIYFGDTAHLPYGEKSPDAIRTFSLRICQHLIKNGAKAIVIACNSASSVAFEYLEERINVPIFNVIDPLIDELQKMKPKGIGVWGTHATINSKVYNHKLEKLLPGIPVYPLATPLLVPLIEENHLNGEITDSIIQHYLKESKISNLDHLVLACTHYPLIASQISKHLDMRVTLLRTPTIVADWISIELANLGLLQKEKNTINHSFEVSDYTETFKKISGIFFGDGILLKEQNIWKSADSI
jgi:glutamate racemase|tara:strand:- start:6050 stop:6868 length:819 start_codon:yes stop_codon:yes gene_type:complete